MPSPSSIRPASLLDAIRGVGTVGLLGEPRVSTPDVSPPGQTDEEQTQAIMGLQAQVAALEARLVALEQAPPPAPPDLSGYATAEALQATNTEVAAVSDDLTALEDRVTALENPPAP